MFTCLFKLYCPKSLDSYHWYKSVKLTQTGVLDTGRLKKSLVGEVAEVLWAWWRASRCFYASWTMSSLLRQLISTLRHALILCSDKLKQYLHQLAVCIFNYKGLFWHFRTNQLGFFSQILPPRPLICISHLKSMWSPHIYTFSPSLFPPLLFRAVRCLKIEAGDFSQGYNAAMLGGLVRVGVCSSLPHLWDAGAQRALPGSLPSLLRRNLWNLFFLFWLLFPPLPS